MSGRHALGTLTTEFTPERRARVEARKGELRAAIPIHELRQAREMTQKAVCEVLKVNQPAVAELERRRGETCMSPTFAPASKPWAGG